MMKITDVFFSRMFLVFSGQSSFVVHRLVCLDFRIFQVLQSKIAFFFLVCSAVGEFLVCLWLSRHASGGKIVLHEYVVSFTASAGRTRIALPMHKSVAQYPKLLATPTTMLPAVDVAAASLMCFCFHFLEP